MRRPAAALLGTVAGTILLVGFKYGTASHAAAPGITTAGTDTGADGASSGPAGSEGPGTLAGPGVGGTPTGTASAKPTVSGQATTAPGRGTTTSPPRTGAPPPTTGGPACTNVAGNAVNVSDPGTGAVTVTITVCNKAITVSSSTLSRSNWSANSRALPSLNSLAVQYYKTDFSKIHYSGATLTSNAYQSSLRSAMGKAGI